MTTFQVSHPVRWSVVGMLADLPSTMLWSSEDPVAVKVAFGDKTGITEWIFARDLLADVVLGKYAEAGDGDVHVSKRTDNASEFIVLTLSVGHVARLQAESEEIRFFLEATFMYTPQGKEEVDIDTTIDKLLDGGWASGV